MNERYKIKYTRLFDKDLNEILGYIKLKLGNVNAANRLYEKIIKEITERAYSPDTYEKYNSKRDRDMIFYRIYVKKYTIFYTVNNNTMEVRRILYSRRNFKKII